MLFRFLLSSLLVCREVRPFLLHPSYSVELEDSAEIRVDDFVQEKDYEMIGPEEAAEFRIDDKENKLGRLQSLASKWYESERKRARSQRVAREWFRGTPPAPPVVTDADADWFTGYASTSPPAKTKRGRRQSDESVDVYEYDYAGFMKAYYDESIEEAHSNQTYNATKAKSEPSVAKDAKKIVTFDTRARNCTEEEMRHIGLKAIGCIVREYSSGRESGAVLARRLWRICKIWLMVYAAIAVPLWCTRGWCCCCLYCKFFKPRQTIDAAKVYLAANPPGVMAHRDAADTVYVATEYEVDSYEQFDHFIRTM